MKKDRIVVIGGNGHVGQKICLELAAAFPGNVYAAGRNKKAAEQFCSSTNGRVLPMHIDVTQEQTAAFFTKVKLVIVCVDQSDNQFARKCLAMGVDYIDITASYSFLETMAQLDATAKNHGAAAVLSVGLAPGLTNLLAAWVKAQLDSVSVVDLHVMLGLGDEHGKAAIEWTLNNVKTDFWRWTNGEYVKEKSFSDGKTTNFGVGYGWRNTFRFNFSDQHVLHRTLEIPDVSTRLCFDSAAVTTLIAWLKKTGLLRLLPVPLSTQLLLRAKAGKPVVIVKAEGEGVLAAQPVRLETMIRGEKEADITAAVACLTAKELYQSDYPGGVYHIEQLFRWEAMYPHLTHLLEWEKGTPHAVEKSFSVS